MAAFNNIKPAEQLWSPNWQIKYGEYNASAIAAMEANFETIFCGLDTPLALHFQDVRHSVCQCLLHDRVCLFVCLRMRVQCSYMYCNNRVRLMCPTDLPGAVPRAVSDF